MTNDDIRQAFQQIAYETKVACDRAVSEFDKAERDGYVGDLYRTDFTVTGRGAFPLDMLRYCNAWPKDERDAATIENSIAWDAAGSEKSEELFVVCLTKHHRDPDPRLADERWLGKFRWRVLRNNTIETTRLG